MATATPQQPSYPPVDGMAPVELDVEAAQPAAAAPAASSSRKRLRRISVGGLFAQQDWGSTLATLLLSAALGIVWLCTSDTVRPFSAADATLAYPIASYGDTWPISWVLAILGCASLATIGAVELWVARHTHADATARCAAFLYFLLDALMALLMNTMVTEVSKRAVGRWRPNALARCQPQPADGTVVIGAPASANPACTAPASHKLTDAHYSFPSGHSSTAFVLAVWAAAYLTWALNVRVRRSLRGPGAGQGLLARLRADLGACAGLVWTLALLGFAWAVAISRVWDFMHHPSDVVAGAFLGTVVAAFYVARSTARLPLVVARAPAEPAAVEADPKAASAYLAAAF